jgi:hypothetical protein
LDTIKNCIETLWTRQVGKIRKEASFFSRLVNVGGRFSANVKIKLPYSSGRVAFNLETLSTIHSVQARAFGV